MDVTRRGFLGLGGKGLLLLGGGLALSKMLPGCGRTDALSELELALYNMSDRPALPIEQQYGVKIRSFDENITQERLDKLADVLATFQPWQVKDLDVFFAWPSPENDKHTIDRDNSFYETHPDRVVFREDITGRPDTMIHEFMHAADDSARNPHGSRNDWGNVLAKWKDRHGWIAIPKRDLYAQSGELVRTNNNNSHYWEESEQIPKFNINKPYFGVVEPYGCLKRNEDVATFATAIRLHAMGELRHTHDFPFYDSRLDFDAYFEHAQQLLDRELITTDEYNMFLDLLNTGLTQAGPVRDADLPALLATVEPQLTGTSENHYFGPNLRLWIDAQDPDPVTDGTADKKHKLTLLHENGKINWLVAVHGNLTYSYENSIPVDIALNSSETRYHEPLELYSESLVQLMETHVDAVRNRLL